MIRFSILIREVQEGDDKDRYVIERGLSMQCKRISFFTGQKNLHSACET
jgi:hypothetical protein